MQLPSWGNNRSVSTSSSILTNKTDYSQRTGHNLNNQPTATTPDQNHEFFNRWAPTRMRSEQEANFNGNQRLWTEEWSQNAEDLPWSGRRKRRQNSRRAEGIVHFLIARSSSSYCGFPHFWAPFVDFSPFSYPVLVIYIYISKHKPPRRGNDILHARLDPVVAETALDWPDDSSADDPTVELEGLPNGVLSLGTARAFDVEKLKWRRRSHGEAWKASTTALGD